MKLVLQVMSTGRPLEMEEVGDSWQLGGDELYKVLASSLPVIAVAYARRQYRMHPGHPFDGWKSLDKIRHRSNVVVATAKLIVYKYKKREFHCVIISKKALIYYRGQSESVMRSRPIAKMHRRIQIGFLVCASAIDRWPPPGQRSSRQGRDRSGDRPAITQEKTCTSVLSGFSPSM